MIHRRVPGLVAAMVAVILSLAALAGCGSSGSGPDRSTSSAPSLAADAPSCLTAQEAQAHLRDIDVPGGQGTIAVDYGTGPVGVLLSHQSDGDLCQWHKYATVLASRGYHALAINYQVDYPKEALAGVAFLTAHGATSIVLLGASMGGTISLDAAPQVSPAPAAVLSLSGPRYYQQIDVLPAVKRLQSPVFFAAAVHDAPFGPDAKTLYRAATHAKARDLVLAPAGTQHGVDLLDGGRVQQAMEAFLAKYAPPSG
jgi:hypothetical protein